MNSTLDDKAIPCDKWHLAELTELIDIPMDYFTFLQRKLSTEIYMGIYTRKMVLIASRASSVLESIKCTFVSFLKQYKKEVIR